MTYLAELHTAHKKRLARMGGRGYMPPKKNAPAASPVAMAAIPTSDDKPPRFAEYEMVPFAELRVRRIQRIVADKYGVTLADILGPSRRPKHILPRHVAIYLARQILGDYLTPKLGCRYSTVKLGRSFGGRDHSTILHAVRRIATKRASDPEFDAKVADLESRLAAG